MIVSTSSMPSVIGRNHRTFVFYNLRNTNRTGLRLWPFPWCALRPLINLAHAIRFMFTLRDLALPVEIVRHLLNDLRTLPDQRRPVSRRAYRLFRKLQKQPSFVRPVA